MHQRLIGPALVALSLVYLAGFVPRGWVPHDEGMTGQSAERVMYGQLPHVNYEEPYTGGLAFAHALVFRIAGVNLVGPRWLLFAGAAIAQIFVYLLLRRYLEPVGAAVGAWIALAWSFPNYFAAMPSWWVLVCALISVWSFIRFVETGSMGYVVAAGIAAGAAILVKQTGVYVLAALVLALLNSGPATQDGAPDSQGRGLTKLAGYGASAVALGILGSRMSWPVGLFLLLPVIASSVAPAIAHRWIPTTSIAGLKAAAVAGAACLVPIAGFLLPYLIHGRLDAFINGAFVLPQRRIQFASLDMPSAWLIFTGVPLTAFALIPRRNPATRSPRAVVGWCGLAALVLAASLHRAEAYQAIWHSTRAFVALLPVAGCWWLISGRETDVRQHRILFALITMLAWTSLVQFPFSAPIYFCYITPLAVVAAVVLTARTRALGRPSLTAWACLLLAFAMISLNRGYIHNLGVLHEVHPMDARLGLPRASLTVRPSDARMYRRAVAEIGRHLGAGLLTAGPDCPELYFLSGQFSLSGALFDFFTEVDASRHSEGPASSWDKSTVVVLNHDPSFSGMLPPHLAARLRERFPYSANAGRFEVRWR